MAHIVVLESWLEGHGRVLPGLLRAENHSWTFVTRRPEHYVVAGVTHPILAQAARVEVVETNSVDATLPVVRRIVAEEPASGVFTVCDYYIPQVHQLGKLLGLPSTYSPGAVVTRDKARTRRLLDAAGLPNPRYLLTADLAAATELARDVGFPLVCKPVDLASSALVRRVDDEAELAEAFATIAATTVNFRGQARGPAVLVEECLDGPELSVEAVTEGGRTTVLGVTDKVLAGAPYFIEVGHQFPADLTETDRRQTVDFVVGCLAAVGFSEGVSHTEVRLTADGPRLLEINPRPGGNYIVDLVRMVTGVDLLRLQLAQCLGVAYRPGQSGLVASAGSAMVIPDRAGTVVGFDGVSSAASAPGVVDVEMFVEPPAVVDEPVDNACYLGMVLATDPAGLGAGMRARHAAQLIRPVLQPQTAAVPGG